jgi:hypothetical protein
MAATRTLYLTLSLVEPTKNILALPGNFCMATDLNHIQKFYMKHYICADKNKHVDDVKVFRVYLEI